MESMQPGKIGRLTLVGTPIGNLKDMSPRAAETIAQADVLLCEDTRRTGMLLKQCSIERQGPMDSFHDHSPPKALEKVRQWLLEGKHLAYVTDGGMPAVSDPGYRLVELAKKGGAVVSVIPGPSAVTAFFSVCALPSPKFFFHGFFPRTKGEVERVLELVAQVTAVHIFYESPHRVVAALEILQRHYPTRPMALCREITKIYEETLWGSAEELAKQLENHDRIRGEIVFGIMGGAVDVVQATDGQDSASMAPSATLSPWEPDERIEVANLSTQQHEELVKALKGGRQSKDIAKEFSRRWGISRRALYDYIVKRLT